MTQDKSTEKNPMTFDQALNWLKEIPSRRDLPLEDLQWATGLKHRTIKRIVARLGDPSQKIGHEHPQQAPLPGTRASRRVNKRRPK